MKKLKAKPNGGRRQSALNPLFTSVPSPKKTPQVKCKFCDCELSKNGTRMRQHIEKCTKCNENVKNKYLMNSKQPTSLDQVATSNSGESDHSTPIKPSTPSNKVNERPLASSPFSPAHNSARELTFTQSSKMDPFINKMNQTDMVSNVN